MNFDLKILEAMKKWKILDFGRKRVSAAETIPTYRFHRRKFFLCARIYYIINYIIIIKYIINYIIILKYLYNIIYNYIKKYIISKINYLKFITKTSKDILTTPDYEVIGVIYIINKKTRSVLGRRVYRGVWGGKGRKPRFSLSFV